MTKFNSFQWNIKKITQNFKGYNLLDSHEKTNTKRFVYLSDGVTERKYVIAEIKLFSNKEVSVIEVEREDRALSTLICFLKK